MTAPTSQLPHAIPRPTIPEARDIAYAEWTAMQALLSDLSEDDWRRPTPCTGWTVHMLLRHVVASYEEGFRPWLLMRRIRRARRAYPQLNSLDGRNACQVDDLADLSNMELKAEHARLGPRGIRALCRMPAPLRRLRLSATFSDVPPQPEDTLDFLVRVLATRDAWMHRIDVADAIRRPPEPTEHDAAVVAQVVRDIDSAWTGPPLVLTLTGHAGGAWTIGNGRPVGTVTSDGIDFMRHISGRVPANLPTLEGDPNVTAKFAALQIPF
jgi:uncharacterized protein (TIGR03083 family)